MVSDMASGAIDTAFPVGGGLYYSEENGIYQSNPVASASTQLVFRGTFREDTASHFAVNENNRKQYYYVRTYYPDVEITFYPSIDACLEAVLDGRAGCTTLNGLRANDILKNSRYKGLSLLQTNRDDARCFGVEIGNEGLLKLLNRGINIVGSDYAQNLSYRYTGGLYTYSFADAVREHLALFIAGILAVAALVFYLMMRDIRRTKKEAQQKEAARLALEEKNRELAESKDALSDALIAAEHANRAKTTFLNNMSHDIRTPMNAIVGFTALAASHIDNREQVQDYLGKISVSSQHLLSLINDILEMSRIENGAVELEYHPADLIGVFNDIRDLFSEQMKQKGMDFSVHVSQVQNRYVWCDRNNLSRVLLNIVSNAYKFTPAGGRVSVSLWETGSGEYGYGSYEIRVQDNGIGMSKEFVEKMFNAFERERMSTDSGVEGTGLGLAITKSLVTLMGGTIEVLTAPGSGTQIIIRLKLRLAAEEEVSKTERSAEPDAPADFTGKRLLLVEDNVINMEIASMVLAQMGFTVETAENGKIAVDMVSASEPGYYDAILMDIQMPVMDGYAATRAIRALDNRALAGIPILAMTANAFQEDVQAAKDAGMQAHIAKPIDFNELAENLKAVL